VSSVRLGAFARTYAFAPCVDLDALLPQPGVDCPSDLFRDRDAIALLHELQSLKEFGFQSEIRRAQGRHVTIVYICIYKSIIRPWLTLLHACPRRIAFAVVSGNCLGGRYRLGPVGVSGAAILSGVPPGPRPLRCRDALESYQWMTCLMRSPQGRKTLTEDSPAAHLANVGRSPLLRRSGVRPTRELQPFTPKQEAALLKSG
jgi:hypothetical protein